MKVECWLIGWVFFFFVFYLFDFGSRTEFYLTNLHGISCKVADLREGDAKRVIILNYSMFLWSNKTKMLILQLQYTEEYELRQGKGSFPAMITPGYQVAKRATQLSSNVSVSFFNHVLDFLKVENPGFRPFSLDSIFCDEHNSTK